MSVADITIFQPQADGKTSAQKCGLSALGMCYTVRHVLLLHDVLADCRRHDGGQPCADRSRLRRPLPSERRHPFGCGPHVRPDDGQEPKSPEANTSRVRSGIFFGRPRSPPRSQNSNCAFSTRRHEVTRPRTSPEATAFRPIPSSAAFGRSATSSAPPTAPKPSPSRSRGTC